MSTATQNEHLSIAEAAQHPALNRPSTNALWRWMRRGVKARNGARIKLRHVRLGGKLFTRAEWIDQFLADLERADAEHFDTEDERECRPEPERTQRNEHDQARARLAAKGML